MFKLVCLFDFVSFSTVIVERPVRNSSWNFTVLHIAHFDCPITKLKCILNRVARKTFFSSFKIASSHSVPPGVSVSFKFRQNLKKKSVWESESPFPQKVPYFIFISAPNHGFFYLGSRAFLYLVLKSDVISLTTAFKRHKQFFFKNVLERLSNIIFLVLSEIWVIYYTKNETVDVFQLSETIHQQRNLKQAIYKKNELGRPLNIFFVIQKKFRRHFDTKRNNLKIISILDKNKAFLNYPGACIWNI